MPFRISGAGKKPVVPKTRTQKVLGGVKKGAKRVAKEAGAVAGVSEPTKLSKRLERTRRQTAELEAKNVTPDADSVLAKLQSASGPVAPRATSKMVPRRARRRSRGAPTVGPRKR